MKVFSDNEFNRKHLLWEELQIRKFPPIKVVRTHNHPVNGFDTETYHGTTRLITDHTGRYRFIKDLYDVIEFLTHWKYRDSFNFWYNMNYDIEGFLKLLPEKNLKELHESKQTIYMGYRLKYIKSKFFNITDNNRHTYSFYDLYQFYDTALDIAAQTYLGEGKIVTPFSRDELNEDERVWRQYREEIVKYCIKDAQLTQKLGYQLLRLLIDEFDLYPKDFISKASLSKRYFRERCDIPNIHHIPEKVLKSAFYAYKGGRFELFKKGNVGLCSLYDLKSAYPAVIHDLIDVTQGRWKYVTDVHDEAYYGFYYVTVDIPYQYIAPFSFVKPDRIIIYPVGSFRTVITKEEYETYLPYSNIEIHYGYEFYPNKIRYVFKDQIDTLYLLKEKFEKGDYKRDIAKIIMNSLYGAFYEKIKRGDSYYTGKLFNPIYASIITAVTRIKIFEIAKKYEKDVVAFATDSVLFRGKVDIPQTKTLGGWELERCDQTVTLQSGLYQIGKKVKTRSFAKASHIITEHGAYDDVFDMIRSLPDQTVYEMLIRRPIHLVEAIIHHKKLRVDDVNRWAEFKLKLDINKDEKRVWVDSFSRGIELFNRYIDSMPVYVEL